MTSFTHQQSAHCESGVISALLRARGLPMSEPMAFGLANALAFAYIPLVKLAGQPLIAYRLPPQFIIKGLCKRLGVTINFQRFKNPMEGAEALEQAMDRGQLVGLQTSVYYLPYFPEEMRFHFNAHNLLVYGRDRDQYQISDPVFEEPVTVSAKHLNRARFVRGPLAPKGLMYSVDSVPESIDYAKVIPAAIDRNIKVMLGAPLPIIGVRGIRFLARKIAKLKGSPQEQRLFLGHIVRMQEEIGTGGAGFRFIYASFLQEAAQRLNDPELKRASESMTEVGDSWRNFALAVAKECKQPESMDHVLLTQLLLSCAENERQLWLDLRTWVRNRKAAVSR